VQSTVSCTPNKVLLVAYYTIVLTIVLRSDNKRYR